MTTSISIKKVLVGVAASALLLSPMFAMADVYQDNITAAETARDAVAAAAKADGKISSNEQSAIDAAERAVDNAKAERKKAQDAAARAKREREEAASEAIRVIGRGVGTEKPPYDITKNPAELGAIVLPAGALANKLMECRRAAANLVDGAQAGRDAGLIKKFQEAEQKCLSELAGLISAAIGSATKSGTDPKDLRAALGKVAAKSAKLRGWKYVVTSASAAEPTLKFNVDIVKVNGRNVVKYIASGDSKTVNPKTRIRILESVNGKKKLITMVTFAKKGACRTDKKSNTATCMATFPATPKGVKAATGNVTAKFLSPENKVIATLDVRGGKQFGFDGKQAADADAAAKIAALLVREKEACDILLQRFAQFNTAVSEGNGALSTSDAREKLRKLLDAAVAACGTSNLADEKKALEKVLAGLKGLMGERIGKSPTSRGASAISLSDDPMGARGILIGLFAIFQDKFTIITIIDDLRKSGVTDIKQSAAAAPATPSAPSTPTSRPQAPTPTPPSAPATGGEAPPASSPSSPQEACLPPHNVALLASEVYQRYGKMCWGNRLYVCTTGIYLGSSVTAPDGTRLSCESRANGLAPATSQSGAQTPGGQSTQQSGAARGGCNDSLVRSYCDLNNPDLLHYCDGTASERNCRTSPPGNQRCDERFFPEDGRTAVVAACYSNFSPSSSAHSNSFLGSLLKIFRR